MGGGKNRTTQSKGGSDSALTSTLVEMNFSSVSDLFAVNATKSPTVLWSPSIHDFSNSIIRNFADCVQGDSALSRCLNVSEFDQLDTGALERWMMVLEPSDDGSDFKYLKYGSEIAVMYGRDMTNKHTSEIGGHISEFFIALYSATVIRKEPVLSIHEPPSDVFATVWRRLIYPLVDDEGRVQRLAAINVPDNELRAGLEAMPDPALVVKPSGQLVYSNSFARRLFGKPVTERVHVSDYCNIDIELPKDADQLARLETFTVTQEIGSRNQVLIHLEVRISATYYRRRPYFVVLLKPT